MPALRLPPFIKAAVAFSVLLLSSIVLHLNAGSVSAEPATPDAVQEYQVALGIYRPELPDNTAELERYEAQAGRTMAIVHWFTLWGGWKSAFSRADLEAVSARGSIPFISWEPWSGNGPESHWSLREAILSGVHDEYIRTWARGLAAYGRPVMLRFAHEMHHQPAYPWAVAVNQNTAEEYVLAWRHVHDIFASEGATNVEWVWNPNTLGSASAAAHAEVYRSLYPGDEYVDWVGLDIYNTGPDLDWGAPYWRSFTQVLEEPYSALTDLTSKPVVLPEVGSVELGGSKADWISNALHLELPTRFPKVRALVWFDVVKERPWALHSSPAALQAWTAASRLPFLSHPSNMSLLSRAEESSPPE